MSIRTLLSTMVLMVATPAISQAAGTGYLFVSSEKDNVVTVLDGKSYETVKQIGTAARPRHLQFSPDRRALACPHRVVQLDC